MRIRATAAAAVVSGALALTGAAMPAAQAATAHGVNQQVQAFKNLVAQHLAHHADGRSALAVRPATDPDPVDDLPPLDVTFSKVVVDNGKADVSVGTTSVVHIPYTFTVTGTGVALDPTDFSAGLAVYHGAGTENDGGAAGDNPLATCTVGPTTGTGATAVSTANCSGMIDIHPDGDVVSAQAGPNYHTAVIAAGFNYGSDPTDGPNMLVTMGFAAPGIQRASKLTTHASASSVTKKHTVTLTGALTRADWDHGTYGGYAGQSVKLQFRKQGSTTYTTVKTVKTDSHGNLKTTATVTTSGFWRYTFAATPTTPSATATGYWVSAK